MTIVNARTFNHSPSKVKAMAKEGPVFVTDRGNPTLVVLSIDEYERLSGAGSVLDSLRMDLEVDFEPVISRTLGEVPAL